MAQWIVLVRASLNPHPVSSADHHTTHDTAAYSLLPTTPESDFEWRALAQASCA